MRRGFYLTDIFLLMSGYLNTKNLYEVLDRENFETATFKFLIKRLFRILPLYFFMQLDLSYGKWEASPKLCMASMFSLTSSFMFPSPKIPCFNRQYYLELSFWFLLVTPLIVKHLHKMNTMG